MGTTKTVAESKAFRAKASVKAVDGERTIIAVVSSNSVDSDGEIVDIKSLRLPLKSGGYVVASQLTGNEAVDVPFLIDHNYSVESQIGSVRKAYLNDQGELVCEFGVSNRPLAQDLMTLVDEGHIGHSFSVTVFDWTFDSSTNTMYDSLLIEVSLVFKGANPDARLLAVKSLIKGEGMADATTLAEKKAQLEALQQEIDAEEAASKAVEPAEPAEPEETPAEEPKEAPEASEEPTPAEPTPAPAPEPVEPAETPAPAPEPEVQPPQESKSVKQEPSKMSNSVAVKQIKDPVEVEVMPRDAQLDKYDFAAKQFAAFVNGDSKTLSELNQKAIESYQGLKRKDVLLSTGVTADGGAIIPNAELLTDVYTTLMNYSTVANDVRVITLTEGDALDVSTLITDVVMTEVGAEGGKKQVTKPVLGDTVVSLREFAGIAIVTKKLVRQAAINIYDILRESFARAIANQRAILCLTDASSGIANKAGVVTVTTATGETTVDKVKVKEIKSMPYQVPVAAAQGGKYYISRELLEVLDSSEDSQGRPLNFVKLNGDGLSGTFANGYPFATEEVLGKSGAPHAVFGNFGRYGILLRQGAVESETFNTGTVNDGTNGTGGTDHNLLQENKLAQRVAFYENVGYPLPGAFAKLALSAT